MPSFPTVRSTLPSFLGGLTAGLLLWRWLRRGDGAEIDRQRLEGEAESQRLRLRLSQLQEPGPTTIDLRGGPAVEDTGPPPAPAPAILSLVADPAPADEPVDQAVAEAPTALASTAPGPPDILPDDLQRIKGIGPVMERSLNEQGIHSFAQIAALTKADIDRLTAAIAAFPGRIERDDWVGSARRLLDPTSLDRTSLESGSGTEAPAPQRP